MDTIAAGFQLVSWLIVGATFCVVAALVWLGQSVARQFRQHDLSLRAEVEEANKNITRLLHRLPLDASGCCLEEVCETCPEDEIPQTPEELQARWDH